MTIREIAHVSGAQGPRWRDEEDEQKSKSTNPNERQVPLRRVGIAAEFDPNEVQVPLQWLSQACGYLALSLLTPPSGALLLGQLPKRLHRRPKSQ
jgi:hypothetical protein